MRPGSSEDEARLGSETGRSAYARRKALLEPVLELVFELVFEPVFGMLQQQRNLRQFRTRGFNSAGNEVTLADNIPAWARQGPDTPEAAEKLS